jgi:hypothetical protein
LTKNQAQTNATLIFISILATLVVAVVLWFLPQITLALIPTNSQAKESLFTANHQEQYPTKTKSTKSFPTATPTSGQPRYTIKVVSLAYYPLLNNRLDTTTVIKDRYGEYGLTLEEVRSKVAGLEHTTVQALEAGSSYKGMSDPVLGYQVVDHQETLSAIPLTDELYNGLPLPDYRQMMENLDVCHYVDDLNVKEVWIWSYAGVGKAGWESNFSSSFGDISNSNRNPHDLPKCDHAYTVYDYNYGRETAMAVHDHLHQYEAVFGQIDYPTFWHDFVGRDNSVKGCGDTHKPPNTNQDYQYDSPAKVLTTCGNVSDFNQAQHPSTEVDCSTWSCTDLQYYIWWMQRVPSSWWRYIAEPDQIPSGTLY